jgi:hypothetical protein
MVAGLSRKQKLQYLMKKENQTAISIEVSLI